MFSIVFWTRWLKILQWHSNRCAYCKYHSSTETALLYIYYHNTQLKYHWSNCNHSFVILFRDSRLAITALTDCAHTQAVCRIVIVIVIIFGHWLELVNAISRYVMRKWRQLWLILRKEINIISDKLRKVGDKYVADKSARKFSSKSATSGIV